MQSYIFLDLDDTLFQTLRKCSLDPESHALAVRAYLPDGTPNSYATHKQQKLWRWLDKNFKCVPVTARDFNAFSRVNLTFQEEIVLNHGAVILDNQRNVDPVWMNKMLQSWPEHLANLMYVWADIEIYARNHHGFQIRLVDDFDIVWFGVIKHQEGSEAALKILLDTILKPHPLLQNGHLYWHLNGNNLAILPKIVNKESAVAYLIDRYKKRNSDLITFGAGDSRTDAAFLSLCDYVLLPQNTQLFNALACVG